MGSASFLITLDGDAHTEVSLGCRGYHPSQIGVPIMRRHTQSVGYYSLEWVHSYLFELIERFVLSDWRKYWSTFDGDLSDLVFIFYREKMTPKCRHNGHRMYFDGDYDAWLANPVPFSTLVDRYVRTGYIPFESYVRCAIDRRLGDGPRGGISGYHADGRMVRIDNMVLGDSSLFGLGLVSFQDSDSSVEVWRDSALAKSLSEQFVQLCNTEPYRIQSHLLDYFRMRDKVSEEVQSFFDYVFGLPEGFQTANGRDYIKKLFLHERKFFEIR